MRRLMNLACLVLALGCITAAAEEVRINGGTTVVDRVVNPHKTAVEKTTGVSLAVISMGAGRGMADLIDGKADVAMVSEPLDMALDSLRKTGKEAEASSLKFHFLLNDEIVFVVHKNNPVKKLSWQQIRDIHTGKITNWKEVGGKDAAIVVFTDTLSGGTRSFIQNVVMEKQEYSANSKPQSAVKKVGEQVAITEEGFGGLSKGFVDAEKVKIVETKTLERPLAFVTKATPPAPVAKVVAAFQTEVKK